MARRNFHIHLFPISIQRNALPLQLARLWVDPERPQPLCVCALLAVSHKIPPGAREDPGHLGAGRRNPLKKDAAATGARGGSVGVAVAEAGALVVADPDAVDAADDLKEGSTSLILFFSKGGKGKRGERQSKRKNKKRKRENKNLPPLWPSTASSPGSSLAPSRRPWQLAPPCP